MIGGRRAGDAPVGASSVTLPGCTPGSTCEDLVEGGVEPGEQRGIGAEVRRDLLAAGLERARL